MNTSRWLPLLIVFVLAGTSSVTTSFAQEEVPNFVIIMADDLGYGDLSSYGNDWFDTPHLDRLSRNGLTFTDFHSNGTVCTPTRTSLLTGRYPHRAGLAEIIYAGFGSNRHHGLHPEKETTFAELLKQRGYVSGVFGKWHLGYRKKYNPLHHGFKRFVGFVSGNIDYHSHVDNTGVHDWWHDLERVQEDGYQTRLQTNHAIKFIKNHREKPFVCYVPYGAPHWPYQGPEDKPVREQGNSGKLYNDRKPSHARPAYKAMVQSLDRNVGRIVKTLKQLDLSEDTLVFFCSDNGPTGPGMQGPLRGRKGSVWEGGHRVPGIAWWPGRVEPGKTDQLALTMDLMPTMLDLAGVNVPSDLKLDGQSLRPVLMERTHLPQRTVFWNWPKRGNRAIRRGPWKLVLEENGIQQPKLFHLGNDPGEQKNVAGKNPDRVTRLKKAFNRLLNDVNSGKTRQPKEKLTPPEWIRD